MVEPGIETGRFETQQGGQLSDKGENSEHILVDYKRSAGWNSVVRIATRYRLDGPGI